MKKIILFFILMWAVDCEGQGTWSNLGKGIVRNDFGVLALCADTINDVLYAGGQFDSAGNVNQNSLAKWNGANWVTTVFIESGLSVNALIMYQGNLIVGFSDGTVGQYDGTTMSYLPSFDQSVYCFYIYRDTLYAGGEFFYSGATKLNNIAKWNGVTWLPVDKGVTWVNCCSEIACFTQFNGNLIASGIFDSAGSVGVTSLASYNGNKWSSLNLNLVGYKSVAYNFALEVYKNKLYVNGNFDSVNSVYTTCNVVSWDGLNWDTLFNNTITSSLLPPANIKMKSFDGYLFITGMYENQIPYKYDSDSISTVDSGVSGGSIYAMTEWNGSLYVGGDFYSAIETSPPSPSIARWTPNSTATGIKQLAVANNQLSIYPNPFSSETTLQFSQPPTTNCQLTLYDLTGREIESYFISSGAKNIIIKRNNLPAGMYFYKVACGDASVITGKIVAE